MKSQWNRSQTRRESVIGVLTDTLNCFFRMWLISWNIYILYDTYMYIYHYISIYVYTCVLSFLCCPSVLHCRCGRQQIECDFDSVWTNLNICFIFMGTFYLCYFLTEGHLETQPQWITSEILLFYRRLAVDRNISNKSPDFFPYSSSARQILAPWFCWIYFVQKPYDISIGDTWFLWKAAKTFFVAWLVAQFVLRNTRAAVPWVQQTRLCMDK